jgi:hypothetical protein
VPESGPARTITDPVVPPSVRLAVPRSIARLIVCVPETALFVMLPASRIALPERTKPAVLNVIDEAARFETLFVFDVSRPPSNTRARVPEFTGAVVPPVQLSAVSQLALAPVPVQVIA